MNVHKSLKEHAGVKGHYKFTLRDVITGKVEVFEYDNLIPDVGRLFMADRMVGTYGSATDFINIAALGTGLTPPAASDDTLQTEVYRNAIASHSTDVGIVYVTAYFKTTEVTGTFREAGLFSRGDSSVTDSGILVSRVAINITKTNTQTLTLDWTLTIS
jgi:hypothetical protein